MINNIQKSNEGYYLCEAVNGIGSGLSAVILISVQGRFTLHFYMLNRSKCSLRVLSNCVLFKHLVSIKLLISFCFKLLLSSTSKNAIKLPVVEIQLFYNAKPRARNRLESFGTSIISDWRPKVTLVTRLGRKFYLTAFCLIWASNVPKDPTLLCLLASPLMLSEATTPASTWLFRKLPKFLTDWKF